VTVDARNGHAVGSTIIESLGVYLPPVVLTTDEVVKGCKLGLPIPLERLTGIESRRVVGEGQSSIDLAREAALACLARSKYKPADVDLLICCSISKAKTPTVAPVEPLLAIHLRRLLGMSNALTFDIGNACAGMFTGIAIADALMKTGAVRCAMIVSGEWGSTVMRTAQLEITSLVDQRIPCLTVGDAGAAMILEPSADARVGFHEIDMYTAGRYSNLCIIKPTEQAHGGLIMVTDAIRISLTSIPRVVQHLLWLMKRRGWGLDDIGHLIPHQTSRTTLQDAARQLTALVGSDVDMDSRNVDNLAERGNTATTTHMVALEDAILDGRIQSGENVVFSITGSGITIGNALYTFDDLPDRRRRWEHQPEKPPRAALAPPSRTATTVDLPTRVRVESIGTVPDGSTPKETLALVRAAAEACFGQSAYQPADMDLLIFAGLYRTDYIIEPAIAALIAGELGLNEDALQPTAKKTFAFDVMNGTVGFLNACHVASSMIAAGVHKTALVVASEVENQEGDAVRSRGIVETGSAVILDGTGPSGPGFRRFGFSYYTEHLEAFTVDVTSEGGSVILHIEQDPWLEEFYLECASDAVRRFLADAGLTLANVQVLIPPQVSPLFGQALAEEIGLPPDKLVAIAREGRDLFSSTIPYALDEVRRRGLARPGDVGLIVVVGSGIQVGCALYHF
jgi:3-oxoacyl-[acyl-carrier-protein] synthase III